MEVVGETEEMSNCFWENASTKFLEVVVVVDSSSSSSSSISISISSSISISININISISSNKTVHNDEMMDKMRLECFLA